jgi:arsenical pump membrane protein
VAFSPGRRPTSVPRLGQRPAVPVRWILLGIGTLGAILAFGLQTQAAARSAAQTWPPFVLVTGLLLIGIVANEDGVFAAAAAVLSRVASHRLLLYLSAMLLVALTTVFLNLDTSVAFLTPVLVQVARLRGAGEERYLYGCVFMSNAASLLLPGSNLTNLLVLANQHVHGAVFLGQMALPWIASVIVTILVVALAFRGQPVQNNAFATINRLPRLLSLTGTLIAVVLILLLTDPAIPVLLIGVVLVATRLIQGRLDLNRVRKGIDLLSLMGVYLVAVSLGTLARTWSFPATLMQHAGAAETAAIAALASVLVNNLPAAVLLGSRMPAHPQALLFGLNIGPNLAVTGSLSALIWWQAARSVDAQPSARRYSAIGIILVPLTLAAALLAAR